MKSLLVAAAIMGVISCIAQKTTPPAAVQTTFAKQFPGVIAKKWDKENGKYEANFTQDEKNMSATFDATGKLEETETDILVKDLPLKITEYIKKNYGGADIKEAAVITKPNDGKMYEAEVEGKDLLFDINGKFIKEESEAAEDNEDEKD